MILVPQIMHQIVGPKTNAVIDRCLSSWLLLRDKGFLIKIWNDDLLADFISKEYPFALEAFLHARNHAEAADIARYLLVYHTGGYYMDWDVQLLNKTKFIKLTRITPRGFLIRDPLNDTLASEAFSASKKESYLLNLVHDIVMLYENKERNSINTPQYSGPFRMRDSLRRHPTGQAILSVKVIFAYDYTEIREMPPRVISQPLIHYWLHTWINTSST